MRPPSLACLLAAALVAAACSGPGGDALDAPALDAPALDAPALDAPAIDAGPIDGTPLDGPAPDASPTDLLDLELGHLSTVDYLQRAGTRALTAAGRHWALWDLPTRTLIASGDQSCPVAFHCSLPVAVLAGDVFLVRNRPLLEVRSVATGAILQTIDAGLSFFYVPQTGLASDGSYVWAAGQDGLRVWTTAGVLKVDLPGNFQAARVFAAPLELRLGTGPVAGAVEIIGIADAARTTVPITGTFHTWFLDGERFLTVSGTTVRVYDRAGALLAAGNPATQENLTGQGDHVWTYRGSTPGDPFAVYAHDDLDTPVATFTFDVPSVLVPAGNTIAVLPRGPAWFRLLTLGPSSSLGPPIAVPIEYLSAYTGDASGWLIAGGHGAVFTGAGNATGPVLARGPVLSVSGTAAGTAALSVDSGTTYLLSIDDTPSVLRTWPYRSSHVALANDGATLVASDYLDAAQYRDDRALRVIDTATGAVTHTWPYRWADYPTIFFEFSVARDALTLCHARLRWDFPQWTSQRLLTTITGTPLPDYGPPLTVGSTLHGVHLFSPDGTRAAITPAYLDMGQALTTLHDGGAPVTTIDGIALGWLDNDRLLIGRWASDGQFISTTLYAAAGTPIPTPVLPELRPIETTAHRVRGNVVPAGGNLFFARAQNAVYDLTTGALVWQGPFDGVGGDVAGDHIVYVRGTRVAVERFRP